MELLFLHLCTELFHKDLLLSYQNTCINADVQEIHGPEWCMFPLQRRARIAFSDEVTSREELMGMADDMPASADQVSMIYFHSDHYRSPQHTLLTAHTAFVSLRGY